jgi:hypothetical protein
VSPVDLPETLPRLTLLAVEPGPDDLAERLHPVVEKALIDAAVSVTPAQLARVVDELAAELRRDLGVL